VPAACRVLLGLHSHMSGTLLQHVAALFCPPRCPAGCGHSSGGSRDGSRAAQCLT
jgi:hypothetical protein